MGGGAGRQAKHGMTMQEGSRTVLVTGATAGIGAAVARRFAEAGFAIVAAGRRADRLEDLKQDLGANCHVVPLDVTRRAEVEAAIASLPDRFRAIDVLVNNAGLGLGPTEMPGSDPDDWDRMVDTNIKGLLSVTHAVLPGMIERNRGHIFNLGSIAGAYPLGSTVYGGTKAFAITFSRGLRRDLHGRRIRVTLVEPGSVRTEFNLVRTKGAVKSVSDSQWVYEPMEPEDIAEAIYGCHALPENVNVNRIELMPLGQATGTFTGKHVD